MVGRQDGGGDGSRDAGCFIVAQRLQRPGASVQIIFPVVPSLFRLRLSRNASPADNLKFRDEEWGILLSLCIQLHISGLGAYGQGGRLLRPQVQAPQLCPSASVAGNRNIDAALRQSRVDAHFLYVGHSTQVNPRCTLPACHPNAPEMVGRQDGDAFTLVHQGDLLHRPVEGVLLVEDEQERPQSDSSLHAEGLLQGACRNICTSCLLVGVAAHLALIWLARQTVSLHLHASALASGFGQLACYLIAVERFRPVVGHKALDKNLGGLHNHAVPGIGDGGVTALSHCTRPFADLQRLFAVGSIQGFVVAAHFQPGWLALTHDAVGEQLSRQVVVVRGICRILIDGAVKCQVA